ncbi:MAG: RNA 2',3'-cyclic phosphodiesterase [Gemmatimonadota bacterium]|nr:RNA 2',3'-cyclic phosphodiesterase [Gemmatimonadota bacterium]
MRTFIAIEPPAELRQAFEDFCRSISVHFSGVRWSAGKNIHLTLRFLGEIEPDRLETLANAVTEAAAGGESFRLVPSLAGCFGSKRNPRVIWLGLNEEPLLKALARRLEDSLQRGGFGSADKPFRGHLTLARVKKPLRSLPDWEAVNRNLPAAGWPEWKVSEVHIINSTLTPQGPTYKILKTCALR